jgi:hypothetical protein
MLALANPSENVTAACRCASAGQNSTLGVLSYGHYKECGKDIAALAEFSRAAICDGNLHREPAIIVRCPVWKPRRSICFKLLMLPTGKFVGSTCWER